MNENLYGYDEIAAFRAARSPAGLARTLSKTVITTYGRDCAVASTLFHRASMAGKIGRQMQTWVRFPEGWRVVAAHVSVIDEPALHSISSPAIGQTGASSCAMKARQPPKLEMSRAPAIASASTRKPFTLRPSPSSSVPIDNGGGTAATKRPKATADNAQTSTSIAAPAPFRTRSRPGFGGRAPASA